MKHLSYPAAGRKRAENRLKSFITREPARLFPEGVARLIENAARDDYVFGGLVLLSNGYPLRIYWREARNECFIQYLFIRFSGTVSTCPSVKDFTLKFVRTTNE